MRNETNNERLNVYVGPTLREAVDRLAEASDRDRSEWIRLLLEREVLKSSGTP